MTGWMLLKFGINLIDKSKAASLITVEVYTYRTCIIFNLQGISSNKAVPILPCFRDHNIFSDQIKFLNMCYMFVLNILPNELKIGNLSKFQ